MASRYGRNKKRRHRERIAELEKSLKRSTAQEKYAHKRYLSEKHDKERLLRAIGDIAPGSAFLPPAKWNHYGGRQMEFLKQTLPDEMDLNSSEPLVYAVQLERYYVSIGEVEAWVWDHPEEFRKIVHVLYRHPDPTHSIKFRHAFSAEAMYHLRHLPLVQDHICETVIHALSNHGRVPERA